MGVQADRGPGARRLGRQRQLGPGRGVKALVYVDAFIPAEGETVGQLAGLKPGSCVGGDPTQVFDLVPYPGAPPGAVDAYVKQSLFPSCFANDLPAKQAAVLAATQRPVSTVSLGQPSGPPASSSHHDTVYFSVLAFAYSRRHKRLESFLEAAVAGTALS